MPLDYMLSVLRDESQPMESRMDAAKNAAPYVHSRLSSTEIKGPNDGPVQFQSVEWKIVPSSTSGS